MKPYSIDPDLTLGPVHLTTADLYRAIDFYQEVIGLRLVQQRGQSAWLGTVDASPLVVLTEKPDARPRPPRTTGLYHLAILTPTRLDLARSLQRLTEMDYPLQGASDHLVSEAIYLYDLDLNGIEIYADRPRDTWRKQNGQVAMATVPLNVIDLLNELGPENEPWNGLPAETRIGHVHLQVADLRQSEAFYCDVVGFDRVSRYGPSASFVSAGGYHHHIGMNVWAGEGAPTPPPDAIGLRHFTIQLPDEAALHVLREQLHAAGIPVVEQEEGLSMQDPSNNGILLTVKPETHPLDVSPIEVDLSIDVVTPTVPIHA